eukprot:9487918-Pyramimonas_sp.AAC.1
MGGSVHEPTSLLWAPTPRETPSWSQSRCNVGVSWSTASVPTSGLPVSASLTTGVGAALEQRWARRPPFSTA